MVKGQPNAENKDIDGTLDGQELKRLIEAGLTWLKTNQQVVNSLNVFPVPDGDTGTNMVLTVQAACNEISLSTENNIGKVFHDIAQGALMGARGNSGVILSQLFRGFARTLDNLDTMDAATFAQALTEGRDTAYKGVVRPVEGTILTVASDIASKAQDVIHHSQDLKTLLENIVEAADQSVKRTPDLLPILKQAGVVDAGGKGLFFILEGMLRYLNDQPLTTPIATVHPVPLAQMEDAMDSIEPGQDFEIVIDFKPYHTLNLEQFYQELSRYGTSIQVGEGDDFYRVHIHVPTENRFPTITYIEGIGKNLKMSTENLIEMLPETEKGNASKLMLAQVEPGQIAVVAVSPGIGISRIFASLGAASIIEGGQTMNPSTEEIMNSFDNLPTDKIIILPNNRNIILAANNAREMSKKQVAVIPSKTIPQGLSAMLRLVPDGDFARIEESMNDALNDVDTGEITIATRSVEINGVNVHEGEVITLYNGNLINSSKNLEEACLNLFDKANIEEKERITLFYGDNISPEEVTEIEGKIKTSYPDHEVEVHDGGQPHYQFIIAIE